MAKILRRQLKKRIWKSITISYRISARKVMAREIKTLKQMKKIKAIRKMERRKVKRKCH